MKKFKWPWLLLSALHLIFVSQLYALASDKFPIHWQGFYLGVAAGSISSYFESQTTASPGVTFNPSQARVITEVGTLSMKPDSFLNTFKAGYTWQLNRILLGLELDVETSGVNEERHTDIIPYPNTNDGQFFLAAYVNRSWTWRAKPRFGVITENLVFYVTGGLDFTVLQGDFILTTQTNVTNLQQPFNSQQITLFKPGYVVGIGATSALADHLFLTTEYLHEYFGPEHAHTLHGAITRPAALASKMNVSSNIVTLGLSYLFYNQVAGVPSNSSITKNLFNSAQWTYDVGGRIFLSSGLTGAPQSLLNPSNFGNLLVSRLTFNKLDALTLETFARITNHTGLSFKGNLGAGNVFHGFLHDEDFPGAFAYSNTQSSVTGNISYATFDFGYNFFKQFIPHLEPFIGYNYFTQNLNAYGCKQLAGDFVCLPENLLTNFLGIHEHNSYSSLRVGLATKINLSKEFTLTSEAAYLPAVKLIGQDIHNARPFVSPEYSNRGDGAMLEMVLSYHLSRSWTLGLGGRYWMWNMKNGKISFDFLQSSPLIIVPARFNATRYGMFFQLDYLDKNSPQQFIFSKPTSWQGVYLGGLLGGSWGHQPWSDPFGSTDSPFGILNDAGFGNRLKVTGPMGGTSVAILLQSNHCIYGISGRIYLTDLRGENTLFSGIGGLNGSVTTHYLGTLVAQTGLTFNRTWVYTNFGTAAIDTQYKLNGNTSDKLLGTGQNRLIQWGWTSGVGVAYTLNKHWTTAVEYNYARLSTHRLTFSSVKLINSQVLSVSHALNTFMLGVNYKFNF